MPSALNILFSKLGKMGSLISHLLNEYMNMFATLFLRTVFLSGKKPELSKAFIFQARKQSISRKGQLQQGRIGAILLG